MQRDLYSGDQYSRGAKIFCMKKGILSVVLGVVFIQVVEGQSAQIKAYLQQIAAYEVYIKDAEKGYKIVEDGVHTVGDIKNGTFNLHSAFFSSLKAVNPAVSAFTEVSQVVLIQVSTVEAFKSALQRIRQSGELNGDEIAYIGEVYAGVVAAGLEDIAALNAVITSGIYSMDDGERIRNIDRIYRDVSKRYEFTQKFTMGCVVLDRSRSREAADIGEIGSLYGNK